MRICKSPDGPVTSLSPARISDRVCCHWHRQPVPILLSAAPDQRASFAVTATPKWDTLSRCMSSLTSECPATALTKAASSRDALEDVPNIGAPPASVAELLLATC